MIQELVYTSAPKGLKLGSSGFCTVASSPGMAQNMASFLESLSGYRHLEEPGSRMNPVNFSFLKHRIGGQDYYILSKISDAGLDYSQRSNKIAHHICLTHSDRLGQSPVSILASDVMVSQWLQAPANLPPRNMPRFPAPAIARCSTWEQQFGDAGWAGAMIEKAIQGQNVFVIFRPGTPTLQLLKEAFAILPAEQQWDLSFSTFFTRLPPRVECRIRFVVEGSDEALAAKRNRNALVLSHAMPDQAPASKYADAARSGQPIASKSNAGLAPSIPQPASLGGQEPPFDDDDDDEIPIVDEEYRPEPIPIRRKKQSGAPDLPSGKKSTSAAPSPNTPTPRNSLPEMPIAQGGSRSALWLTLVICIALMILTNVGTFFGTSQFYGNQLTQQLAEAEQAKKAVAENKIEINDLNETKSSLESELKKYRGDLEKAQKESKNKDEEQQTKLEELTKFVADANQRAMNAEEEKSKLDAQCTVLNDQLQQANKQLANLSFQNAVSIDHVPDARQFAWVNKEVSSIKLYRPAQINNPPPAVLESSGRDPWDFSTETDIKAAGGKFLIKKVGKTYGIILPGFGNEWPEFWVAEFIYNDGKSEDVPTWQSKPGNSLRLKKDQTENQVPVGIVKQLKSYRFEVKPNAELKRIFDEIQMETQRNFKIEHQSGKDKFNLIGMTKLLQDIEKNRIDSETNQKNLNVLSSKENPTPDDTKKKVKLSNEKSKLGEEFVELNKVLNKLIDASDVGLLAIEVFLPFENKKIPPVYSFEIDFSSFKQKKKADARLGGPNGSDFVR